MIQRVIEEQIDLVSTHANVPAPQLIPECSEESLRDAFSPYTETQMRETFRLPLEPSNCVLHAIILI